MQNTSLILLLTAAAVVAVLHSILPDHWVPLAVVARTQRWKLIKVAWISALASAGHVIASLVLAGIVALIGLQFQSQIETQQGHIIGGVLVLTGLIFLFWGLLGSGGAHGHSHAQELEHDHHDEDAHQHDHNHADDHKHEHAAVMVQTKAESQNQVAATQPLARRLAAIAIPFGVAASPDLTILPVALGASAIGGLAVVAVLGIFALITIATFVLLAVFAALIGYQIKGAWIEKYSTAITAVVLIAIGMVAFIGF